MRVVGGKLSDKFAASKVTEVSFIVMMLAVVGVIFTLPTETNEGSFTGFFVCFMLLFAFTGIGNASTFAQAPRIFGVLHRRHARAQGLSETQADANATKESAAVVGFMGAIGAYGGFLIPKSFGTSIDMTGSAQAALMCFIIFYASCVLINWWYYARKNAEVKC